MTKEEKQLLLIDLSARLPYGVKCWASYNKFPTTLVDVNVDPNIGDDLFIITVKLKKTGKNSPSLIEGIKPYLRPMSSMTEEESEIINNISNKGKGFEEDEDGWIRCDSIHTKWGVWPDGCAKLLDYLNSIHVDYRGLIPMGLALEAPEGMYKTE